MANRQQIGLVRVLVLLAVPGCTVGSGEGWIKGRLWVENCNDGEPIGQSADEMADYDLQADFFAGEPREDSNAVAVQRRNRLTVRIQDTSNNMESTNGLLLQLLDLDLIAASLAQSKPVPVTAKSLCNRSNCNPEEDAVRAKLFLYATCPSSKVPLIGSSHEIVKTTGDPSKAGQNRNPCLLPTGTESTPCPTLTSSETNDLEALCASDFMDRGSYDEIGRLLGSGACMYICRFGSATKGQSVEDLRGFFIDYGDQVAGLLSMRLVDGRAVSLNACSSAGGLIQGMFSFEVARGRAAQTFP